MVRSLLSEGMAAFQRALQASTIARTTTTVSHWLQHSFLYRWLTAEPDPEVIVIDLRETYTVGPLLAVLDRIIQPLARSYRTSTLKRIEHRGVQMLDAASETRLGRLLGRVLTPPEPPETDRNSNPENEGHDNRE